MLRALLELTTLYRKEGKLPSNADLLRLESLSSSVNQPFIKRATCFLSDLPHESNRMERQKITLRVFSELCAVANSISCPEIQEVSSKLQLIIGNIEKYISDANEAIRSAFISLSACFNSYTSEAPTFDNEEFVSFLTDLLPECSLLQQPFVQKMIEFVSTMPHNSPRIFRLELTTNLVREFLDGMRHCDDPVVMEFTPRFDKFHRDQNNSLNSLREAYTKIMGTCAEVLSNWVDGHNFRIDLLPLLQREDSGTFVSPNAPLFHHIHTVLENLPQDLSDYERVSHSIIVIQGIIELSKTMPCQVPNAMQPFESLHHALENKRKEMQVDLLARFFAMWDMLRQRDGN
jgi:hypothetical protein